MAAANCAVSPLPARSLCRVCRWNVTISLVAFLMETSVHTHTIFKNSAENTRFVRAFEQTTPVLASGGARPTRTFEQKKPKPFFDSTVPFKLPRMRNDFKSWQ